MKKAKKVLLLSAALFTLTLAGCVGGKSQVDNETMSSQAPIQSHTDDMTAQDLETNTSISEPSADISPSDNDEGYHLQSYFTSSIRPSDEEVVHVNKAEESGNYRITVCEAFLDKTNFYFLVRLETVDGSALPAGDLSQAPEGHSPILTDIYWDFSVYMGNEDNDYVSSTSLYCDRVDQGEEANAGYFVLGGSCYLDNFEYLDVKTNYVELAVRSIVLYTPYLEAAEERVPLVTKELFFEVPVEGSFSEEFITFSDGKRGYLSSGGFWMESDLDIDKDGAPRTWKISFLDGTELSSKDINSYITSIGLNEEGIIGITWYGNYVEIDQVLDITVGGELYAWE